MDYFSHGFWSYIIFNKIKKPFLAVFFGLLPDSMSWLIYAFYRLFTGAQFGKPNLDNIPTWTFVLYNISHSLFVAFFVIIILWIILRKFPIYALAWPIAITMDLFTHRRDFLPTPFLWPVSNWHFPGISWGTWQFTAINYILIVSLIIIIIYKRGKANK